MKLLIQAQNFILPEDKSVRKECAKLLRHAKSSSHEPDGHDRIDPFTMNSLVMWGPHENYFVYS